MCKLKMYTHTQAKIKFNDMSCTIFSLDAENDGDKVFLVVFHVSPLELNRSLDSAPSVRILGNGCREMAITVRLVYSVMKSTISGYHSVLLLKVFFDLQSDQEICQTLSP